MKLIIPIIIVLLFLSGISSAQNNQAKFSDLPLKERLFLGGNLGLQLGNRTTFIEVSPLIGLWLSPSIVAGAGPVYRYFRINDITPALEENQYGARLFGRYYFLDNFFAHAEYEALNLTDYRTTDQNRTTITSVLGGGGYVQSIGRSALFVMVLYNFSEGPLTPYNNPVIRAGFNIGL